MTVNEYRVKHPKCTYCKYRGTSNVICGATSKGIYGWTARKCPVYKPAEYKERDDGWETIEV